MSKGKRWWGLAVCTVDNALENSQNDWIYDCLHDLTRGQVSGFKFGGAMVSSSGLSGCTFMAPLFLIQKKSGTHRNGLKPVVTFRNMVRMSASHYISEQKHTGTNTRFIWRSCTTIHCQ